LYDEKSNALEAVPNPKINGIKKMEQLKKEGNRRDLHPTTRLHEEKCPSDTLASVAYHSTNGEIVEPQARSNMESVIMTLNEAKLHQAQRTPFIQAHLADVGGKWGTSLATINILTGTYNPPEGLNPHACHLLKELKQSKVAHTAQYIRSC
jgi:hypothetical protein